MDGPFHDGERRVQALAGLTEEARQVGRIVGDRLSAGARTFLSTVGAIVLAGTDAHGRCWVGLRTGPPGFVRSDERTIHVIGGLPADDPLATLAPGAAMGTIAVDMAHRRRFRTNGTLHAQDADGVTLRVDEAYGNCPKYIDVDARLRAGASPAASGPAGARLTDADRALVGRARTFFVGSRNPAGGADASHRGGPAGFLVVEDDRHLSFPDYDGNAMFNTLGNLVTDPAVGLLVIDPDGRALRISGRAEVEVGPARRAVRVTVDAVRS